MTSCVCAGLRTKWQADRSPAEQHRLHELGAKTGGGEELSTEEEAERRVLATVEQDIILVTGEGSEDEAYDANKLRAERLRRMSEVAMGSGAPARAPRDASRVVSFITLKFFADEDQFGKDKATANGVEISLPFSATWSEVCDMLRKRFQRIMHFRYINDKNVWLEVRSEQSMAIFRTQMGEEGLEKGASVVVAQVKQLPFGSGGPHVAEALRDSLMLSSLYQVGFLPQTRGGKGL